MAITSGYFNSVNGDRKYNADQMSEYFEGIINEGVCQHIDGGLAVTAGTGLSVNVAAGKAFIGKKWIRNDASLTLTISAASASYARIDAVVLRRNNTTRTCQIVVKSGTPAASPAAPTMTRNSTTYEMALAYVNVAANATSVTVTDKRADTTVCGWATVAQETSGEVDAMLNAMKTGFDGVVYDSPEEMVTSCDTKLDNKADMINKNVSKKYLLSFELGAVNTTNGEEIESTTRSRTDYIPYDPNGVIYVKPGFKIIVIAFNNSKTWTARCPNGNWMTEPFELSYFLNVTTEAAYIRIMCAYDDNRTISDVSIMASQTSYLIYNDNIRSDDYFDNAVEAGILSKKVVNYVLGGIDDDGQNVETNGRARAGFFDANEADFVYVPKQWRLKVFYYSARDLSKFVKSTDWYYNQEVPIDNSYAAFRILVTKTNGGLMYIQEAQKYVLMYKYVNKLNGRTFAVVCDSIGTHGNEGTWPNVPEITITADDVGVELKAYLTYYDMYTDYGQSGSGSSVYTGMSLGGNELSVEQIGTEITFTPIAEDVGKKVGKVHDWNGNNLKVWWTYLAEKFGMTPIPVCWASSSYSSHEDDVTRLKAAYAWHDSQIRKCGIRTPGTMDRTAPNYIILARGCNDLTHTPYTKVTDGLFDSCPWTYPANDQVTGGYGIKEALCLTIKKLRSAYPLAQIILCTIPYVRRVNYSEFPANNGDTTYPQWNDAIREVADFFGCKVIDFAKDGVTNNNNPYFTADGTHPNADGHIMMGREAVHVFENEFLRTI